MPLASNPKPVPWRHDFLCALSRWPDVKAACDSVGIAQTTAYRQRKKDRIFADAWRRALSDGRERLTRANIDCGKGVNIDRERVLSLARDGRPRMALAGNHRMTPERETRFFELLMETASISAAARGIGISLTAIYNRRQRDAAFNAAIIQTLTIAAEALTFALIREGANSVAPTIANVDTRLVSVSRPFASFKCSFPNFGTGDDCAAKKNTASAID